MDAPFDVQSLVLPDTFLPSQFQDRHRPHRSSLQRLAYAILDLTLHDMGTYRLVRRRPGNLRTGQGTNETVLVRRSRYRNDARAWLTDTAADSLFSFRSVCELLAIDADRLRSAILNAEREGREAA